MMGVGKTTVGSALAQRLGVAYVDNDVALAREAGATAAELVKLHGVTELHVLERSLLTAALARDDEAVVSAPGSIALDPDAPQLLRGQTVVWLRATLETLLARLRVGPERPLIGEALAAHVQALLNEREPGFARIATCTIEVDGLTVEATVEAIVQRCLG